MPRLMTPGRQGRGRILMGVAVVLAVIAAIIWMAQRYQVPAKMWLPVVALVLCTGGIVMLAPRLGGHWPMFGNAVAVVTALVLTFVAIRFFNVPLRILVIWGVLLILIGFALWLAWKTGWCLIKSTLMGLAALVVVLALVSGCVWFFSTPRRLAPPSFNRAAAPTAQPSATSTVPTVTPEVPTQTPIAAPEVTPTPVPGGTNMVVITPCEGAACSGTAPEYTGCTSSSEVLALAAIPSPPAITGTMALELRGSAACGGTRWAQVLLEEGTLGEKALRVVQPLPEDAPKDQINATVWRTNSDWGFQFYSANQCVVAQIGVPDGQGGWRAVAETECR